MNSLFIPTSVYEGNTLGREQLWRFYESHRVLSSVVSSVVPAF